MVSDSTLSFTDTSEVSVVWLIKLCHLALPYEKGPYRLVVIKYLPKIQYLFLAQLFRTLRVSQK